MYFVCVCMNDNVHGCACLCARAHECYCERPQRWLSLSHRISSCSLVHHRYCYLGRTGMQRVNNTVHGSTNATPPAVTPHSTGMGMYVWQKSPHAANEEHAGVIVESAGDALGHHNVRTSSSRSASTVANANAVRWRCRDFNVAIPGLGSVANVRKRSIALPVCTIAQHDSNVKHPSLVRVCTRKQLLSVHQLTVCRHAVVDWKEKHPLSHVM